MSYEYETDRYGNIREYGGGFGLKAPERRISDKDKVFLERVIRELDGEAAYDLRNIMDLQREYGDRFQVALLNGLFNYRDMATAEVSKLKSERDFMIKANTELMGRVKALQAENERLIMDNQKKVQKENAKAEKVAREQMIAVEVAGLDVDINTKIIQLHNSQISQRKIAEILKVSTSTVNSVIKNYYLSI